MKPISISFFLILVSLGLANICLSQVNSQPTPIQPEQVLPAPDAPRNQNNDTLSQPSPNSSGNPTIEFFGDGSIQKSLNNGTDIPTNTGIGIVYKEVLDDILKYKWLMKIELGVSINIASNVDTLKAKYGIRNSVVNTSDFGSSILLPLNSGQAFDVSFKGYFGDTKNNVKNYHNHLFGLISGFYINFTGSNRYWSDSSQTIKASTVSNQIGIFHEFIRVKSRNNYSLTLCAGYTSRWILGDIAQKQYKDIRSNILNSNTTSFNGFEFILGMRLKNIKAGIRVPILNVGKGNDIAGLTGVQPNTFIVFEGGFPLSLNQ